MRPLTRLPLLAVLAACPPGPGPTTDSTTTATTGETDASTGTTTPTTGVPDTTAGTSSSDTGSTGDTTTTAVDLTTTAPDATTTTTTADDTTTTTADDTTTSTTADTTTGPDESALVIAIVDAELYADCQPRIDPDPVEGGWTVSFDNTAGASETAATLVSATLSLADLDPPVLEPILVDPTASGPVPAGEQLDQSMDKLHGDMHSACDHCGEFYKLVLTYDENGTLHVAEEDVTISCSR